MIKTTLKKWFRVHFLSVGATKNGFGLEVYASGIGRDWTGSEYAGMRVDAWGKTCNFYCAMLFTIIFSIWC